MPKPGHSSPLRCAKLGGTTRNPYSIGRLPPILGNIPTHSKLLGTTWTSTTFDMKEWTFGGFVGPLLNRP